jgi:hypothetical protein
VLFAYPSCVSSRKNMSPLKKQAVRTAALSVYKADEILIIFGPFRMI